MQLDYAWLVSLVFTLVGVSACRRSNVGGLKVFQFGILGEFSDGILERHFQSRFFGINLSFC
jgi:hypothetical protein